MANPALFPDGPESVYRVGHAILAREGVLLSDSSAPAGDTQRQLPSTLLPSPLPRPLYKKLLAAQPALNRLYQRVSREEAFLEETLGSVLGDEFTRRLWELCQRTRGARRDRASVGNSLSATGLKLGKRLCMANFHKTKQNCRTFRFQDGRMDRCLIRGLVSLYSL